MVPHPAFGVCFQLEYVFCSSGRAGGKVGRSVRAPRLRPLLKSGDLTLGERALLSNSVLCSRFTILGFQNAGAPRFRATLPNERPCKVSSEWPHKVSRCFPQRGKKYPANGLIESF